MSKNFVTGFFKTRAAAEAAVDAIIKRGYTRDDISVLMSDATKNKEFAVQTRSHAADGLGIGSAIGGTVGAVLAAIAFGFLQSQKQIEAALTFVSNPPQLIHRKKLLTKEMASGRYCRYGYYVNRDSAGSPGYILAGILRGTPAGPGTDCHSGRYCSRCRYARSDKSEIFADRSSACARHHSVRCTSRPDSPG